MAEHAQLRIDTGLQIFFCDPQSPWQRGTNENTNGLLRQYFPKGTDLSRHSRQDLDAVALALNTRPRKTLGWRTPAEALDQLLRSAQARQCCDHRLNLSCPGIGMVHQIVSLVGEPIPDGLLEGVEGQVGGQRP
jgi:hypothetical protein